MYFDCHIFYSVWLKRTAGKKNSLTNAISYLLDGVWRYIADLQNKKMVLCKIDSKSRLIFFWWHWNLWKKCVKTWSIKVKNIHFTLNKRNIFQLQKFCLEMAVAQIMPRVCPWHTGCFIWYCWKNMGPFCPLNPWNMIKFYQMHNLG